MRVPEFKEYGGSVDSMNAEQREYFEAWVAARKRGVLLPVEGNISYLFSYVGGIMNLGSSTLLQRELHDLVDAYSDEISFAEMARLWLADTYVLEGKYETALDTLPSPKLGSRWNTLADTVLSLKVHVDRRVNGRDVIALIGPRVTKFGRENLALVEQQLDVQIGLRELHEGINLLNGWREGSRINQYSVFTGTAHQHFIDHPEWYFSGNPAVLDECQTLLRQTENVVRQEAGLPNVGEGWIAETELYYQLRETFAPEPVVHHAQFDWLGRQHLDIYFPERRVAVEFQGAQHDEPVAFFGGEEAFILTTARDRTKRQKCQRAGVRLLYAREGYDLDELVAHIRNGID